MLRRLLLAALLPVAVAASAAPTAASPDFSADRFRAHVSFLSDDLLEGRDTGSRGYDIAAAYVASQFEGLGLKPGGTGGGWFESVPLRRATLVGPKPVVTISGPTGRRDWENGSDVLVGPSVAEQVQDIEAPVVFAGYGLDSPPQGVDDYAGLDVRGKVVAVLAGAPTDLPSEIAAHLSDTKDAAAARRGAIGLVVLPTDLSEKATPWPVRIRHASAPRMAWLDRDGRPEDEAPGLRIGATLNTSAAEALFAGAAKGFSAVRAEASNTRAHPGGFALATKIRIRRSSQWAQVNSPEVIGMLPGSDPELRGQYVVLMAHLDHLGIKDDAAPGEDRIYNGALDNAAGIATMLEAARAFVASGKPPKRSVIFIANTGEEKGLLGADYFAHFPTVPIASIAAVVDLDMPLLLYDFTDVIAFGADHSTLARAVADAAGQMGVALSPDPMPEENIFVRSDHYMFVRQGVPGILLATGFANGGEKQWREFLSTHYHSVADDMRQPIHWTQGARYAELNYRISRILADAPERPRWYEGDFFGDRYAPAAPRVKR